MKTLKQLFLLISIAIFVISGCEVAEIEDNSVSEIYYASVETFDVETKTTLKDGRKVSWLSEDQIAIFEGNAPGLAYQILDSYVGKSSGEFLLVDGYRTYDYSAVRDGIVAVYPFNKSLVVKADRESTYVISGVTFPSEQTYTPDTFADDSFPMAAICQDESKDIFFKNVGGVLKLSLKGSYTVSSIALKGNSNELLSGAANVSIDSDGISSVKMSLGELPSVTLVCNPAVKLNEDIATDFYISIPPTDFERGFTITVTDSEGSIIKRRTDKHNKVLRSRILAMPEITLRKSVSDSNDPDCHGIDYIDEYGTNHGPGIKIDNTIWAPVNCGYHETDFKYGKLYQWGRKYGQGYYDAIYHGGTASDYSDASVPEYVSGPVHLNVGQSEENAGKSYTNYPGDWLIYEYKDLWNLGTEDNPIKTEYDPCPDGWRVPTYAELSGLSQNYSERTVGEDGQTGFWFSGLTAYSENAPQLFFPEAGFASSGYYAQYRGRYGYYYSSKAINAERIFDSASLLYFVNSKVNMSHIFKANGCPVRCVKDDRELVHIESITLSHKHLNIARNSSEKLFASICPSNASHKKIYWWSDNPKIATVDEDGNVNAVYKGTVTITAMVGMQVDSCVITVLADPERNDGDYIDEYGINHGQGVKIGETLWAPVNCGYHETDFKYGKLYQWGRKYGQGYSGWGYKESRNEFISDATYPVGDNLMVVTLSNSEGQKEIYRDVFFASLEWPHSWVSPLDSTLWNLGMEDIPVKTNYDPCPEGWRVPTISELSELSQNYSECATSEDGPNGILFTDSSSYSEDTLMAFLPFSGYRMEDGSAVHRGSAGRYWSSTTLYEPYACYLDLDSSDIRTNTVAFYTQGGSVRCVKE